MMANRPIAPRIEGLNEFFILFRVFGNLNGSFGSVLMCSDKIDVEKFVTVIVVGIKCPK